MLFAPWLIALVVMLSSTPARATEPFAWDMPTAKEQLHADDSEIPVGMGAIFVPTISGTSHEPPAILVSEEEVREVPLGQRAFVHPGVWTVVITSSTPGLGTGVTVKVEEGRTALVPVEWGALRIEVTDTHRVPHRGSYEIIRADTREPYGTGFGADTLQGETLNTWLLPPGIYRIVRAGSDYRTLKDFATVYVPEGGFVRFRLVTDPATGEHRASGVLMPDEFGSPDDTTPWFTSLVVGGGGSWVQKQNVVGTFNHTQLTGDVYLDGQLQRRAGPNLISGLLQIEEGASLIRPTTGDPMPLIKTRDRVRADGLYTHFLREDAGPYFRVAGETQLFSSSVLALEDTTVHRIYRDEDGDIERIETEEVGANSTFHVADPFQPTILREGVGVNARLLNRRFLSLNWRVGFGLRQNLYGGSFVLSDDASTEVIEYDYKESFNQQGFESTIVATVRLPGWITYYTDVELFAGFGTLREPSIEWRNNVSLRLTRYLSLDYYASVNYLPQVVENAQFEQSVLLRASWAIW